MRDIAVLFLVAAVVLTAAGAAGCSATPAGAVTTGRPAEATAGGDGVPVVNQAAPVVNPALYSDDYAVDEGPSGAGEVSLYATPPDTFNPLLTRNMYTRAMLGLIYEGLARIGPEYDAEPLLADAWEVSQDGLTWYVTLKADVSWQDGRPLSAQDVTRTVDRIREYGELSPYADLLANVESVAVTPEGGLSFRLIKANAWFPHTLIFPVTPAHMELGGLEAVYAGDSLRQALIGTGPYRCQSYRPDTGEGAAAETGAGISLTVNDGWHGRGRARTGSDDAEAADEAAASFDAGDENPPPYIQEVRFLFFDPAQTAFAQFRTRGVDMFFSRAFDYSRFKSGPGIQVARYCEREFLFVALNNESGATADGDVRRALSRMIDREALVEGALNGRGVAAEYPVQPDNPLYEAVNARAPYDPQAAAAILEGAGFRLDDGAFYGDAGDGWGRLEIDMLVDSADTDLAAVARRLSEELLAQGVLLNVVPEAADVITRKVSTGAYEAALLSYRTRPHADMTELYSVPWFSDGDAAVLTGGNVSSTREYNPARYRNPDVDRLAGELYIVYDEPGRRTVFAELVTLLRDDAPYLGLCFRASSLVCGENMFGSRRPSAWEPLLGFENWYMTVE